MKNYEGHCEMSSKIHGKDAFEGNHEGRKRSRTEEELSESTTSKHIQFKVNTEGENDVDGSTNLGGEDVLREGSNSEEPPEESENLDSKV